MFDKLTETASKSSPVPSKLVEPLLQFLEVNVRQPLSGTWFDRWIALPAKNYYVTAKRRDWRQPLHSIKVTTMTSTTWTNIFVRTVWDCGGKTSTCCAVLGVWDTETRGLDGHHPCCWRHMGPCSKWRRGPTFPHLPVSNYPQRGYHHNMSNHKCTSGYKHNLSWPGLWSNRPEFWNTTKQPMTMSGGRHLTL